MLHKWIRAEMFVSIPRLLNMIILNIHDCQLYWIYFCASHQINEEDESEVEKFDIEENTLQLRVIENGPHALMFVLGIDLATIGVCVCLV